MAKKVFSIGTDPEFFLAENETGQLRSAIPHINGTKEEPAPLPNGGNIQRDNVAVEFATDPAVGRDDFVGKVQQTFRDVLGAIPKGHKLAALPSAQFDPAELDHPEAKRFGCDPDYDAWKMQENEAPCIDDKCFRSCGAHIHVGCEEGSGNEFLLDFPGKVAMVKTMDCMHGLLSTILDNSEEAIARRKLYGKAGSHRPKEYGVEYRVLSNYWLKSPVTVMLMYCLTKDALKVVRDGKDEELIGAVGENEIQNIINNGLSDEATKVMEKHVMPHLSEDSVHYFNEALAKIKNDDMHLTKEWELEETKP